MFSEDTTHRNEPFMSDSVRECTQILGDITVRIGKMSECTGIEGWLHISLSLIPFYDSIAGFVALSSLPILSFTLWSIPSNGKPIQYFYGLSADVNLDINPMLMIWVISLSSLNVIPHQLRNSFSHTLFG